MMHTHQARYFSAFKDGLRDRCGTYAYRSYFDNLELGTWEDERVELVADSGLAADRISEQYADDVYEVWTERCGPVGEISVTNARGGDSARLPRPPRIPAVLKPKGQPPAALRADGMRPLRVPAPLPDASIGGTLNRAQTIENFCVASSNRLARLAVDRVVEGNGAPITYIYGANGRGKSHLLHAAAQAYLDRHASHRLIFLTYESLIADVSDAFVSDSVKELRSYLSNTDLLVFDDIQFLRGRKRTQEELACLLERLQQMGRRVLIAGTLSPGELAETGIAARLADRLGGGASVPIAEPDVDLRLAVANQMSEAFFHRTGLSIPQRHIDFIARRCEGSVRELQGVMQYFELAVEANRGTAPITDDWVRRILDEKLVSVRAAITIDDIFAFTNEIFGVSGSEMRGKSRKRPIVRARQAFCLAARKLTDEPLTAIGSVTARDHTTVMHSIRQAEIFAASDLEFGDKINRIFERFQR